MSAKMYSALKLVHNTCCCNLPSCQIRFFCESLGNYLEKGGDRRSNRLLRKEMIPLISLYPVGFLECNKILKKGLCVCSTRIEKKKCEIELAEFNVLKKFDDFLKVLSFYHVERCEHEDCYSVTLL